MHVYATDMYLNKNQSNVQALRLFPLQPPVAILFLSCSQTKIFSTLTKRWSMINQYVSAIISVNELITYFCPWKIKSNKTDGPIRRQRTEYSNQTVSIGE